MTHTASGSIVAVIQRLRDALDAHTRAVNDVCRYAAPGPAGDAAKATALDHAKMIYETELVLIESDFGWNAWCDYCTRNRLSERDPDAMTGVLQLAIQRTTRHWTEITLSEAMRLTETIASDHPPLDLTPCERDCTEAVAKAGKRLHRADILAALDGQHGASTIRDALARLVKLRVLTAGKGRAALGYGMPAWGDGNGPATNGNGLMV